MAAQSRNIAELENASVWRLLIQYSLPSIAGMVAGVLLGSGGGTSGANAGMAITMGTIPQWPTVLLELGVACLLYCERRLRVIIPTPRQPRRDTP